MVSSTSPVLASRACAAAFRLVLAFDIVFAGWVEPGLPFALFDPADGFRGELASEAEAADRASSDARHGGFRRGRLGRGLVLRRITAGGGRALGGLSRRGCHVGLRGEFGTGEMGMKQVVLERAQVARQLRASLRDGGAEFRRRRIGVIARGVAADRVHVPPSGPAI
jgi:hypothetical protein